MLKAGGALCAIAGAGTLLLPGPASAAQAQEPLRIGWIKPTTGILASGNGPVFVNGLIAVDEINAAGGILGRQIVLVEEDDQGSPAMEPQVIRKLADANVRIVVGPDGSSQTLAALGAATQFKMLQTGVASIPQVGNGRRFPYFYQMNFTTEQQAEAGVRYLVDHLGIKKLGVIRDDNSFGELLGKGSVAALARRGFKLQQEEVFTYDTPDLTPYIANLRRAGAEGLLFWMGETTNVAQGFSALDSMQWYPDIAGHISVLSKSLFDLAPDAVMKKVYGTYYRTLSWLPTEPIGPKQLAFGAKLATYPEALHEAPLVAGAPMYDFLHLLKVTIEQEKTFDAEKLKVAFDQVKGFDGLLGTISFTPTKHLGLDGDQTVMVSAVSGKNPKAMNIFRERAPM